MEKKDSTSRMLETLSLTADKQDILSLCDVDLESDGLPQATPTFSMSHILSNCLQQDKKLDLKK